ncbi:hypothetical protein CBS470a_013603 [Colletotrichum nupharicola]|nr:hypothetical protein CBS470a_013603 [Colletotrichum nupharicola]
MADTTEQAPPEQIEAGDAGQSEDEFEPQEWESSSSGPASVTSSILQHAYANGRRNLKPGAWVETQDFSANITCDDGTMPDDWYLLQFWEKIRQAMSKLNIDIQVGPRIGKIMEEAGFVNVQKKSYKVPVGT